MPDSPSEIFDKAMENKPISSKENADEDYLIVYDGEKEIKIPKSAKVKLSSKAGDNIELSVKDWATAPWSQRENAKLVEARGQLQRRMDQLVNRYGDLDSLIDADPTEIKGKDWATQVIKTIYKMNPKRGDDLKELFVSVQKGTLSEADLKKAELQAENLKLKQGQKAVESQASAQELAKYGQSIRTNILEELDISPEHFDKKLQELNDKGQLDLVNDPASLQREATKLYTELLFEKADKAVDEVGFTDAEIKEYKNEIVGLLYANTKQSSSELAKKLRSLIGRPTAQAREKVSNARRERTDGSRKTPDPKPNKEARALKKKGPFQFLEEKYGHIF